MRRLFYPAAAALLCGCATARPDVRLTSEPSIERAMDLLNATPDGKDMMHFLNEHPVDFEYSNTPDRCDRFLLHSGRIYIPEDYRDHDLIAALDIARAAYIYRLWKESGLDEVISEEEELGALFQARLAVELKLTNADFARAGGKTEIKNDLCAYLLEGSSYAMELARKEALTEDTACQRPLETLENQKVWLEKTRQAIDDQTFYQLLYDRDLARVRKGSMTMAEAMKRDAEMRALPLYEVYRYQRSFYDDQNEVFSRFEKLFKSAVRSDAEWRRARKRDLDASSEEFSACELR